MKELHNYSQVLDYVNRLGYGAGHTIVYRQGQLCDAANIICAAAGIGDGERWPDGATIAVKTKKYISPEGHYFPWKNTFIVRHFDGHLVTVHLKTLTQR